MINDNMESLLILEADATWDLNVRTMTERIAAAINKLMREYPDTAAGIHGSGAYRITRGS
jgi:hypothetical protein